MKEENVKVEELNSIELMRLIFEEVKHNGQEINRVNDELKIHRQILKEHDKKFDNIENKLNEHDKKFDIIENKLSEHDKKFDIIEKKLSEHDNRFNRIEQKIDYNFKYLDEKIDNTKDKLISEIAEELNNFSIMTTRLINNLEKKIDNEIIERKTDISKIKGLNEYDRIILNDLQSRISILEEESEKYNLN